MNILIKLVAISPQPTIIGYASATTDTKRQLISSIMIAQQQFDKTLPFYQTAAF
jgi:hypothetical protein